MESGAGSLREQVRSNSEEVISEGGTPDGSPYPLSLRDISLHCRESPAPERLAMRAVNKNLNHRFRTLAFAIFDCSAKLITTN